VSKYKTVLEKGYTPNWTTEVFKITVQRTDTVTYLLEHYKGKSIIGVFYEYELHRGKNIAQEGKRSLRKVAGIR